MMKLRIASCGGQPCVLGVSPFLDWNTEEDKRGRGLLHGRLWIPNKAWGHGSFWCVVIVLLGSLDLLQKIKVKLPALPFPSTQHLWIGLEDWVSIWWKIWIAVRLVAVAIRWGLDDVDARKLSTIMWTRIFRGPGWIGGSKLLQLLTRILHLFIPDVFFFRIKVSSNTWDHMPLRNLQEVSLLFHLKKQEIPLDCRPRLRHIYCVGALTVIY